VVSIKGVAKELRLAFLGSYCDRHSLRLTSTKQAREIGGGHRLTSCDGWEAAHKRNKRRHTSERMVDLPAIHNLRGHELEDPTISKEKKGLEASNKPAGLAADFFFRPTVEI
jgi:hypothetical protein